MSRETPRWLALKVRVDCPECGSVVFVDGPYKGAHCHGCGARTSITNIWPDLLARAADRGAGGSHFRPISMVRAGDAIPHIVYAVNRGHPPLCPGCDAVVELAERVPTGHDGHVACGECGLDIPTWPAPGFLKQKKLRGHVRAEQIVAAPPESRARKPEVVADAKPVIFGCLNCGANLRITTESQRVVTCEYCETDSFLPAEVWNRLHPVRRRRAFWVRVG